MEILSLIYSYGVVIFAIGITLGLAVAIHEFGHMMFMLLNKVPVESFAIGFGPKIFAWHWGGIEFSVRWLPLGGFVKPKLPGSENAGVEAAASGEKPETGDEAAADEKSADAGAGETGGETGERTLEDAAWDDLKVLEGKSLAAKLMVFGGGVFMNLVIAIVAMVWLLTLDISAERTRFVIDTVPADSAAAEFGLQKGDNVVAFNGQPIRYLEDFEKTAVDYYQDEVAGGKKLDEAAFDTLPADVSLTVERGGEQVTLPIEDITLPDLVTAAADVLYIAPVVGETVPAAPATRAGIKPGDRVVSINGQPTGSFNELSRIVKANAEKDITVIVERKGEQRTFQMKPFENVFEEGAGQIGIYPYRADREVTEGLPFFSALAKAPGATIDQFKFLVSMQIEFFSKASFKQITQNVGGPVMISVITAKRAKMGLAYSIDWFIKFNLLLIFFNLLPIPVLDGGFIVIAIIESIIRRPIPRRIIEPIYAMCMYLIIGLMATIVLWDFWRAVF